MNYSPLFNPIHIRHRKSYALPCGVSSRSPLTSYAPTAPIPPETCASWPSSGNAATTSPGRHQRLTRSPAGFPQPAPAPHGTSAPRVASRPAAPPARVPYLRAPHCRRCSDRLGAGGSTLPTNPFANAKLPGARTSQKRYLRLSNSTQPTSSPAARCVDQVRQKWGRSHGISPKDHHQHQELGSCCCWWRRWRSITTTG